MKKAKVMLSAIAVLAIVGGALAFKSAKFGGATYFVKVAGVCNSSRSAANFTAQDPGIPVVTTTIADATLVSGQPCSTITLYAE